MHEDFHFLRSLFNQPSDAQRLIYADWLEERGDPRAQYLRLEVELHRPLTQGDKKRKAALGKQLNDLQRELDFNWVRRIWRTRYLPQGMRVDLVSLEDGKGMIEVRGGEAETVLLVEGKPVALNLDDCAGSVGQYLVFTGHTCGSDYVRQLRGFVAGDVGPGRPLLEQIEPLLVLFASGTYCLAYTPAVNGTIATLEYSPSSSDRAPINYYPAEDCTLVCTQPRASLNEERVAFFCEQIRAQQRPIVLTAWAEGAWCGFVIDGHHKLEAYTRLGEKPASLAIERWEAPAISLDEGIGFLPQGHGVQEYRRSKERSAP